MKIEKCDDCGHYHHPNRAHTFDRPVVVETKAANVHLAYMEPSVGAEYVHVVDLGMTVKCSVCGVEFRPKRRHAQTCSPKCRQRKRRARP